MQPLLARNKLAFTVVSQAEAAYFENTFNLEGTVSDKSDRAFPDVGCLWPHRATVFLLCLSALSALLVFLISMPLEFGLSVVKRPECISLVNCLPSPTPRIKCVFL